MSHSGSFLVGSQLDPTLGLLMPSPGRLVPGAIPLPSRAQPASAGEAASGEFRALVQRRSAPPDLAVSPTSFRPAAENSLPGTLPGMLPGALPDVLTDTNSVALPQVPSIESQTSESRGAQAQEASDSAPVPLQPAPAPPPGTFPETLPAPRPASSSNLAADFRQALAHYRAAALQLG